MGIFFEPYRANACCLCGSNDNLTGEHKIKASELRAIFGPNNAMVIGAFDGTDAPRSAQGPRSKEFHFEARLCKVCNSERTQPADREFVRFHRVANDALASGKPELFTGRYAPGSSAYLNVSRYFAKLMCCHLAESNGPRPISLAAFATGACNHSRIALEVDRDWTFEQYSSTSGEVQLASHGGLAVFCNRNSGLPTAFHSSVSFGLARYTFEFRLAPWETVAMVLAHPKFTGVCRAAFEDAIRNPVPENTCKRVNIRRADE